MRCQNMNFCSLGRLCHAVQLLIDSGVRDQAYPFDWIGLPLPLILHCIENDFVDFLDKNQYTLINSDRCGHVLYKSVGFFHHQPLIKENDYEYLCRCVERFRALMSSKDHKTFLILNVNQKPNEIKSIKKEVLNFNKQFCHYTNNYKLISIAHTAGHKSISHEINNDNGIDFINFYSTSESNGIKFSSSNDNNYLSELIKSEYIKSN